MAKIFPILGYMTFVLLEQLLPVQEVISKPDFAYYAFQTGIASVLFTVWFITQKTSSKLQKDQAEKTANQYAEIFKQLKDVHKDSMDLQRDQSDKASKQFAAIFEQQKEIHKNAVEQNNRTLDRMFSIMQEDIKYKALIAETMTRFQTTLPCQKS
jgi:hypothetical protein